MPEQTRETWITGIGIVSCLGEGPEAHWTALDAGRIVTEATRFAPYVVHPIVPLDFDKQIAKKGDQRQMEAWQRTGTYAAGLALDDAGLKGNPELLSRTDLIVAAGGGERDEKVDSAVLTGLPKANDPEAFLNERLMGDLRPTLFLAQLSNLLAGNISIVHGVTGSSRTLLGEEAAGIEALRIGAARIAAGQSDIALVGAAQNAERKDLIMLYEFGGFTWKGDPVSVWSRGPQGGFSLGSHGAFLVLEASDHARARGATPIARLTRVVSDWTRRQEPGAITATLERMFGTLAPQLQGDDHLVISGATGAEPGTAEERAFFAAHPELTVRATATNLGHGLEPQFPINVALAAVALRRGSLFAGSPDGAIERPYAGKPSQIVVTGVGHWRGEGMALVEAAQ